HRGFLREEGESERATEDDQPSTVLGGSELRKGEEGQRSEEHLWSVEQRLTTHHDVVRHEREERCGEEAGAPAVEQRPEGVGDDNRREAEEHRDDARDE